MPVYQIANWQDHFESSRSREIENPAMVLMPNKQHGMGFLRVTRLPGLEGAAAFGLWCMMLQACSRQKSNAGHARAGWLTDDGTSTGQPWDAEDLALRWALPVEFVQRVMDLLCSPKVGWMKAHTITQQEVASSADHLPAVCRPAADLLPTEQNRTEQNRTENTPAGELAKASPELPYRLRDTWREIFLADGADVANRALTAGRRIFRSPSPAQLLETWKCAAAHGRLQEPPDRWPDFRQAMRADRQRERAPGTVQADAETLDLARQWDEQDRKAKATP